MQKESNKNHSSQKKWVCSIVDNTYKIARDWRPEKTTDGISSSLFPSNILKRFEASLKILYISKCKYFFKCTLCLGWDMGYMKGGWRTCAKAVYD